MTAASTTTCPEAAAGGTWCRPAPRGAVPGRTAPGRAVSRETVSRETVSRETVPGTPLTAEDLKLLTMLADGALLGAVARHFRTSERTIRRRVRGICDVLGVDTPIQAVVWAARLGLL